MSEEEKKDAPEGAKKEPGKESEAAKKETENVSETVKKEMEKETKKEAEQVPKAVKQDEAEQKDTRKTMAIFATLSAMIVVLLIALVYLLVENGRMQKEEASGKGTQVATGDKSQNKGENSAGTKTPEETDKPDNSSSGDKNSVESNQTDTSAGDKTDVATGDKTDKTPAGGDKTDDPEGDKTDVATGDKTDKTPAGSDKTDVATGDKTDKTPAGSDKTDVATGDKTDKTPAGSDKTDVATGDKTDETPAGSDKTDVATGDKTDKTPAGSDKTDVATGDKTDKTPAGSDKTDDPAGDKTDVATGDKTDKTPAGSDKTDVATGDKTDKTPAGSDKTPDKTDDPAGGYLLTYSAPNAWEDGNLKMCTAEMSITNQTKTAVNGWTLVLEIEGLDKRGVAVWNGGSFVDGNKLTITNAEYNGAIAPGGSVYTGCQLGASKTPSIKSATLNGVPCTVKQGTVNQNDQNNQGNQNQGGQNQGGQNQNPGGGTQTPPVDVEALLERSEKAVQGDDWLHTDGNRILDKDGKQVWLTGVNWFGYNTGTNTFDGLWNSRLEPTVKAIADHGFNLIRVPISAQLINQWAAGEYPRANYNNAYNTALNGMNSLEIFEYFLTLAESCGLKVMPDIHSAETDASGHNVNLWYTSKVSVEEYYAALEWMAARYKNNDTIIAYDLKNEPHGKPNEGKNAAIWNNSKDANNWKYVAETAAAKVLAKNPNVLILVEGIEIYPKNKKGDYSSTNSKDYYFNWWGGNLRAVRDFPINLGKYQNKLVYSPHDYGPTVFEQPWFEGNYTYESLMKDCWKDNWLYIQEENIAPLLIGEWGGFMREPNLKWMTCMRKLIKTYHLNHTFWCLNANSGDTGGLLLDDFTTWDDEKYEFVKEVLWQENGKFVGLDHAIPLGDNGITTTKAKGLK